MTVNLLMSIVPLMWNECLIRLIFSSVVANATLNIILGSKNNRDERIWHYSLDGIYSNKNGYKLISLFFKAVFGGIG